MNKAEDNYECGFNKEIGINNEIIKADRNSNNIDEEELHVIDEKSL